jgi:hypothetical protein
MYAQLRNKTLIAAAACSTLLAGQALAAEGDGFPHIAVAQETTGELALEFSITTGLDETTTPPTINLIAPQFSSFFGGYQTIPLTETAFENSDLGFVSEVEGAAEEGGAINGDIVVRMLTKDTNFQAFFEGTELFTTSSPDFLLGNQFDRHPTWVLAGPEGTTDTASASFEVFDVTSGAIGSGAESLGQFDVVLAVPEPSSALALLAGAGLIAARRRRRG